MVYIYGMVEISKTPEFSKWFEALNDRQARARVQARIDNMELGNLGDVKPVGNGVSETRISYGPGYRVYFLLRGKTVIILLAGGDKSTQKADIAKAKEVAAKWKV